MSLINSNQIQQQNQQANKLNLIVKVTNSIAKICNTEICIDMGVEMDRSQAAFSVNTTSAANGSSIGDNPYLTDNNIITATL